MDFPYPKVEEARCHCEETKVLDTSKVLLVMVSQSAQGFTECCMISFSLVPCVLTRATILSQVTVLGLHKLCHTLLISDSRRLLEHNWMPHYKIIQLQRLRGMTTLGCSIMSRPHMYISTYSHGTVDHGSAHTCSPLAKVLQANAHHVSISICKRNARTTGTPRRKAAPWAASHGQLQVDAMCILCTPYNFPMRPPKSVMEKSPPLPKCEGHTYVLALMFVLRVAFATPQLSSGLQGTHTKPMLLRHLMQAPHVQRVPSQSLPGNSS